MGTWTTAATMAIAVTAAVNATTNEKGQSRMQKEGGGLDDEYMDHLFFRAATASLLYRFT